MAEVKGRRMFDSLIHDRFLGFVIVCTVALTTALVLLSQMIILDKGRLALKCHSILVNQELLGSGSEGGSSSSTSKRSGGGKRTSMSNTSTSSDMYDNLGRYGVKGSSSSINRRTRLNQITTELKLWGCDIFSNELGALSTSRVLSICANIHITYSLFVSFALAIYAFIGWNWYCLILVYISMFSSAMEIGFIEHSKLNTVAKEISARHEKKL